MVAALAAAAATTPVPINAPMVEAVARVVRTVVVMVPSNGCADRLGAGLSPGLRKRPAPIDRHAHIFFRRLSTPAYAEAVPGHSGRTRRYAGDARGTRRAGVG
ncbi:hypothetical protein GCM10007977_099520 [Dactylosporangium sucinum]|uniref:Uncharacterized protein n=1 Tax=Dactylosporangium sucinum TaxID=1424081 RepID=A0A917X7C5_9ACTN|nr:hypothetical protein GCM10007977_099520 [Dactylosporangium sucinum]